MIPADRVREAARSAVVQFTALLEYLDHIAKGRDGSPHVDAEDRSALDALRAALALPVAPAKPDEVGAAREAFYEAARAYCEAPTKGDGEMFTKFLYLRDALAAERAAKEPK